MCPYCKPKTLDVAKNKYKTVKGTTINKIADWLEKRDSKTKTCPKCKTEIPNKSIVCPQCKKTIGTTLTGKILVAIVLTLLLYSITTTSNKQKSEPDKFDAQIAAEYEIKRMLKAPATAKFPRIDQWLIEESPENFRVRNYVDAQNSFGALLRTSFDCVVQKKSLTTSCLLN